MEERQSQATEETPLQAAPAVLAQPTAAEVEHALALARMRGRRNNQNLFKHCSASFHAGERAKRMGWQRVSCAYADPLLDEFFFDGYDGKSWEEAVKRLIG